MALLFLVTCVFIFLYLSLLVIDCFCLCLGFTLTGPDWALLSHYLTKPYFIELDMVPVSAYSLWFQEKVCTKIKLDFGNMFLLVS